MPKKPDAVAALAARVVEELPRLRESSDAYPPTLPELGDRLDASPEQLGKALAKKPFAAQLIRAQKTNPASLVALAVDADRLAASLRLLAAALDTVCTAATPVQPLKKVVGAVNKLLQPAFAAVLERRHATDDWPAGVGCVLVKKKPHLYLERFPPPRPPEVELADRLVRALEARRAEGAPAYPVTLARLLEQAAPGATATLVKKALAQDSFRSATVVSIPENPGALVALLPDRDDLVRSPALLESALAATRTPDNQAMKVADLAKKLDPTLRGDFLRLTLAALAAGPPPAGVGGLRIKKTLHLFLLRDLGVAPPVAAPPPPVAPDVDKLIEDAFTRLDRERGGHNLVSLLHLRNAVPVARAAFDTELQRLRRSGRFTLASAEGRHGLTPEERDAGIVEDGVLLLYVSRTAD